MTDPNVTPVDQDDPLPSEEETIETGAWADKHPDEEPSATPEPPET